MKRGMEQFLPTLTLQTIGSDDYTAAFSRKAAFSCYMRTLGTGSIFEKARGRCYPNITVKVPLTPMPAAGIEEVMGIDLVSKDLVSTSDGAWVARFA